MDTNKIKKYSLKIFNDKGEMKRYNSNGNSRRISSIISRVNFKKAYIKVSYGKKICILGCLCEFYNDGWYYNNKELLQAFNYFRKEEI